MTHTITKLGLALLLTAGMALPAAAQAPANTSTAATTATAAAQPDDPDRDPNDSQPDFYVATLNTNLRLPNHKMSFRLTHRFLRTLGDGDVELVAETTLEDITSFPLSYRLEGDPKTVFAREGDYFLFVDVYSDVGNTARVGDLTNEMHTPVPNPGAEVAVEVTGLESCNSPDVGGVCAGDTPD